MISLADPILGREEKGALSEVIDSKWLTMGDRVRAFELAFANLHGVKDAVAVNSCTAGLHLCLSSLGIGSGDEVLVPSLTFVATVNTVLYVGATPIFVDIDNITSPHISLTDAEAKISSKVKAVMVMHYGGYLVDMSAWRRFCDYHGLMLIEDAAHAPAVGCPGRLSDASSFSFFSNKNMTTAEGGMVLARKSSVIELIRCQRSHGMTTTTLDRQLGHAYSYDVTMLGFNYRMDEMRAALGFVQLARLPHWNKRRQELAKLYRESLNTNIPEVIVPFDTNHETAAHLMAILLPERANKKSIMHQLKNAGIQSSIHYPPVHLFSFYNDQFPDICLPRTEEFFARELTLPLHPSLNENDIDKIVRVLKKAVSEA